MAKNIENYVAKAALVYAYAREEEINTLKRKLELTVESISQCRCCTTRYHQDDWGTEPIILGEECRFCGKYMSCQNCLPETCSICKKPVCPDCCAPCNGCEEEDELNFHHICLSCSGGTFCFGCHLNGDGCTVSCPKHPFQVVCLSNGYNVPACLLCRMWLPGSNEIEACLASQGRDMIEFYGMLHRAQKKAKQ